MSKFSQSTILTKILQITGGILLILISIVGMIDTEKTLQIMRWVLSSILIVFAIAMILYAFLAIEKTEKTKRIWYIVASVIVLFLGILPMIFGSVASQMITIILMILMFVVGCLRVLIGFKSSTLPRWKTNTYILVGSIASTLSSVVLIFYSRSVSSSVVFFFAFLLILTGGTLILDGVTKTKEGHYKIREEKKRQKSEEKLETKTEEKIEEPTETEEKDVNETKEE